jgi:hypothetical protein
MLYFKATASDAAFEPALTRALAARWPERQPRVLAIDAARAWMLMEDAGAPLREIVLAERDPARWEALLADYARFQIATSPYVAEYIALGCPDRRLERLPEQYAALVADVGTLLVGAPGGLSEDAWRRARAFVPEVEALCAETAGYGLPAAKQHDDLGPGNVLLGPHGTYVFFDWSDASVAHPLLSLFIPLRWCRYLLDFESHTLDRLRDAYLEPWTVFAPKGRLLQAQALAHRLGKLSRALTWQGFVTTAEPGARWEYAASAPYFLRIFLNDDEGD